MLLLRGQGAALGAAINAVNQPENVLNGRPGLTGRDCSDFSSSTAGTDWAIHNVTGRGRGRGGTIQEPFSSPARQMLGPTEGEAPNCLCVPCLFSARIN